MVTLYEIPINKSIVPYSFLVELSEKLYKFELNYNAIKDFFTINLYLNDEAILYGEKLMYNVPLFLYKRHLDVPSELIVPISNDDTVKQITYDNFGDSVKLYAFAGDINEII